MNGAQDVGGMMGFGPVRPEPEGQVFHAEWEKRALGITLAAGTMGHWNIDESRHARESLSPADYYASSYFEIWTKALEALLVKHGFVTPRELAEGRALTKGTRPKRVPSREAALEGLKRGTQYVRPEGSPPLFLAGDRVRARLMNPRGHTRLPRYVRGRTGLVEAVHPPHVFPDSHAHGKGEAPQRLYTVVFQARDLWGEEADPTLSVSVDAWESYLERA